MQNNLVHMLFQQWYASTLLRLHIAIGGQSYWIVIQILMEEHLRMESESFTSWDFKDQIKVFNGLASSSLRRT